MEHPTRLRDTRSYVALGVFTLPSKARDYEKLGINGDLFLVLCPLHTDVFCSGVYL